MFQVLANTAMIYFSKFPSLRQLHLEKNLIIDNFLHSISRMTVEDWNSSNADTIRNYCKLAMISIILRPKSVLKESMTCGVIVKKLKVVLTEIAEKKESSFLTFLRGYWSAVEKPELYEDWQRGYIDLLEHLMFSRLIADYAEMQGCDDMDLCFFVIDKILKVHNLKIIPRLIQNPNFMSKIVSTILDNRDNDCSEKRDAEKLVISAKQSLCSREFIEEHVCSEFVASFHVLMSIYFGTEVDDSLYVSCLIETLGGITNKQLDKYYGFTSLEKVQKDGIKFLSLIYINNNASYTVDGKHRPLCTNENVMQLLRVEVVPDLSNKRFHRPILLRSKQINMSNKSMNQHWSGERRGWGNDQQHWGNGRRSWGDQQRNMNGERQSWGGGRQDWKDEQRNWNSGQQLGDQRHNAVQKAPEDVASKSVCPEPSQENSQSGSDCVQPEESVNVDIEYLGESPGESLGESQAKKARKCKK